MNYDQKVYTALIALNAIVNLPSLFHLIFHRRTSDMAVIAAFQSALDELDTSIAEIKTLVAAGSSGPSAQDVSDTVAAVQQRADAVTAALVPPAS